MSTKKTKEITYLGTPQIIPQQIAQQIPTYENSGVKYQGFYKRDIGSNNFEVRTQTPRFYVLYIENGAFGSTLIPRTQTQKKFFCTKIFIQWHGLTTFSRSLGEMHIADVKGTNATTRFYFYPTHADGEVVLDLSDAPRLFEGEQFDLYTQASLGAAEFIVFSLFGWEED